MNLEIEGHIALVTGGGRGLGRAIAASLAREGALVIIADRDEAFASAAAEGVLADGGRAEPLVVDVTNSGAVDVAVAGLVDRHGRIDILVNCAGLSRDASIGTMTNAQWHEVMDVCLTAPFYVTRAVAPGMAARGYGRIVNISSRARDGDINKCNYAAAKAGLVGFTAALALELGKSGVTVNAVAPGFCDGERPRSLANYEDLKSRALALTPTARLGEEADVADAVCYLCAYQTGYVTGEVLSVAGGRWR